MVDLTSLMSQGVFDYIFDIIDFLTTPEDFPPTIYSIYQVAKVFFVSLSLILLAAFFFLTSRSKYFQYSFKEEQTERKKGKPFVSVKLKGDIEELVLQAKEKKEVERKLAVIEVDDLLSDVLLQMEHKGDDLIEQLKNITEEILPNIEELKQAHLKRKKIIENPEQELSEEEAVEIVSTYKESLKYLRVL
jgi:hypothetical protein